MDARAHRTVRAQGADAMASPIRLLTALDEAQLRRLEPRLYHLVLTGRARRGTSLVLVNAVEEDAAPEPYALVVEPLAGIRELARSWALRMPRACHVSLITRSPWLLGATGAARALSELAGGPRVFCYQSLEAAVAAAQRAVQQHPRWRSN